MTEFVNDDGDKLEYSGDEITFTKQIASFREFKIKGDFTASFTLNNNSENRKALGYANIQQVGNHAFAPNPFSLIRNGNFDRKGFIIIEDDEGPGGKIGGYFVSGNANWFKAFEFPLNQISNSALQVQWNITAVVGTIGKTYGIIFPLIDWVYSRNKFDKHWATGLLRGAGDPIGFGLPDMYPCLYIHTLVQELAKTANIRIAGNLLDDQLYKTLIMTPEGPDLYYPDGSQISNLFSFQASAGPYIPISAIPSDNVKAVDFIKWLCFSFGCVPTFDEFSQTLSLDFIDKIKKEEALDWSDYFQRYEVRYNDFFEHNRIKVKNALEEEIAITYNKSNLIPFGAANIRTKKEDGSETTLYTSPFPPVKDDIGTSRLRWATPFVQFAKLKDEKNYTYTTVTNVGGFARFDGDFSKSDESALMLIVRIEDDAGVYTGMHVGSAMTTTDFTTKADFISTSTGKIYFQKLTKQITGNRILVSIPSIPVNNLMSITGIRFFFFSALDQTSVPSAYFSKPQGPYGNLNNYVKGLTYGELSYNHYNDISLTESYWNKIQAFIRNPPLDGYFLLPEAVFAAFKFDSFVFIRSKDLTGYFFIDRLENYRDSTSEVKAEMNYIDGYSGLTGYNTLGVKAGYPEVDATGNAVGYDSETDYDKYDVNVGETNSYLLQVQFIDSVGLGSWSFYFDYSPSNDVAFSATFPSGNGSDFTNSSSFDTALNALVSKVDNGGIAEATVTIDFYLNGVVVATQGPFIAGTSVINISYTYIGLSSGDTIKVIINE